MKITNRCVRNPVQVQYGYNHICSVHGSKKYSFCSFSRDDHKTGLCDFVSVLHGYCNNRDAVLDLDPCKTIVCRVAGWIRRVH
jgi:hypothetical protein